MKSKKSNILLGLGIAIIIAFISINFMGTSNMDKVYTDNNKIASSADSFSLDDSDETVENSIYKGSFKLSGCGTIWEYKSTSDFDLKASYNFSVKDGDAKIVLISPDNTLSTLAENTDSSTEITFPIKKGTNRIKIVARKKAAVRLDLRLDKGTFRKISF